MISPSAGTTARRTSSSKRTRRLEKEIRIMIDSILPGRHAFARLFLSRLLMVSHRYRYCKGRTLADFALNVDFSSEQLGKLSDYIKPNAHSSIVPGLRAVHLVKALKDSREEFLRNADAGIGHFEFHPTPASRQVFSLLHAAFCVLPTAFCDSRGDCHVTPCGKFHSVIDEILQDVLELLSVSVHDGQVKGIVPDDGEFLTQRNRIA